MKSVFVDQVYITEFGKLDKNLNEILLESGKHCLSSSNKKVDMLLVGSMNPEEFWYPKSGPARFSVGPARGLHGACTRPARGLQGVALDSHLGSSSIA